MQLFHSSTGLIDLSARPAHPILWWWYIVICTGVLYNLWLHTIGFAIGGQTSCIAMSMFSQCISISSYSLATSDSVHFRDAHLTSGGLNFSEMWT